MAPTSRERSAPCWRARCAAKASDMAHWLVKSEPSGYGRDQSASHKRTSRRRVRNHQAAANMKAMKKGDLAFFYHSGEGEEIVGIVRVAKEYYPDHTGETGKFGMVDLEAVKPLKAPVTLKAIKEDAKLKDFGLVRQG